MLYADPCVNLLPMKACLNGIRNRVSSVIALIVLSNFLRKMAIPAAAADCCHPTALHTVCLLWESRRTINEERLRDCLYHSTF